MAFTQDFFTSRRNINDGDTRIGQQDRIWYDSNTNTLRIQLDSTPGGTIISGGGGGGGSYTLPIASSTTLGGIKIGSGLSVNPTTGILTATNTSNGTVTSVSGTGTVSGLSLSGTVTTSGSLTLSGALSLTNSQVTTALGYTPYNSSNPAGYTTNTGTVTSVSGTGTVSGLSLSGTVTSTGSLTLSGALSLTSSQVTTALGYTPYNSSNPSNYITTTSLSVTTNTASNSGSLSYANGVFTFTPPNLTSYLTSEADTLDSVTDRGNTTTNSITVGDATANFFQLDITPSTTPVVTTGMIAWNPTDNTFDMGLLNGVILQAGQETHMYVKAYETISNGQSVMFAGAEGDNIMVRKYDPTIAGFIPEWFVGVATQDLARNAFGYVTIYGKIHDLNTNAWVIGTILYADNNTPGGLTATGPEPGKPHIIVAAVTKKAGGDGHIMVRPTARPSLVDLPDVNITSPSNGQVLKYNASLGYWINAADATGAGGTGIALTDLSVNTSTAAGGGGLTYNNSLGVFTFRPADLSSYLTGITSSQVTTALGYTPYDSSNPNNYTSNTGTVTSVGGTGTISGLTLTGTVTSSGNLTLGGTLSLTSSDVTTGLGYTPYNSSNPNNYITTSSLSVTTNTASSGGSLSYSSGTFTYSPADLSSYATQSYVTTQINNLINGAPGTLDTLKEIADQLALDESAVSALTTTVSGKIGLTELSVTTATASGSGSLSYNNTSGVFTFTPPSLSSYLTTAVTSVSGTGTVNGITLSGTVTTTGSLTLGGTLGNIANSQLSNSTISGVSLGSNLNALTIGTGLGGTSYNGSSAVTITNTDTGSAQNIFKTVAVSGQTSVTAASNTATLTLVAGTGITLTTDNTAKSVTVTAGGSPTYTNLTVTNQLITNQIDETFSTVTPTNGTSVTFDCSTGQIFNVVMTSLAQNFAANLSNLNIVASKATNVTLIINQGATAYVPSSVTIPTGSVTFVWQGGTQPTGTANKKDVVAFSILCTATNTYTVFGQLVTFG